MSKPANTLPPRRDPPLSRRWRARPGRLSDAPPALASGARCSGSRGHRRPRLSPLFCAAAMACLPLAGAAGHNAPTGWTYGWECCSAMDCFLEVSGNVAETAQGYRVKSTGGLIAYGDKRIKRSQDEYFHRCTKGGGESEKISICLYVPDRGF